MDKKHYISFLMLLFSVGLYAQKTITGSVSDNAGPLLGVSILEKGTTNGVQTDFDGNFTLEVNDENAIIVVSFIGMKTQELSVAGKSNFQIVLEEDAEALEEVVITAQGIKRSKKALGYAITELKSQAVEQRPEANLAKTLQGKVAGVSIATTDGQSGSGSSLIIRGSNSISQNNGALIIVNNVPFEGSIRDIDANDIKSMSILKGYNAAVLYGTEGRNGVVLIQTKSGNVDLGEKKVTAAISTSTYINEVSQLPVYQNIYGQGQNSEIGFRRTFLSNWGPAFSDLEQVPHPYDGGATEEIFPQFDGLLIPYTAKPNNVRNFFRTGFGQITSATVTSSQESTAYSISLGYTDESGITINNDLQRFNLSLGGSSQISDKLNLATTLNFSTRKVNRIQSRDVFNRIFYLPRNVDVFELPFQNPVDGSSVWYRNDTNPLWLLNNAKITDDVLRVFGTLNASYAFNDALTLTYRLGYDNDRANRFDFSNRGGNAEPVADRTSSEGNFENGFLNLTDSREVVVDQTIILGFNKNILEDVNLESQIGLNSKLTRTRTNTSFSLNQLSHGFIHPSNFRNFNASFRDVKENIAGLFAQLQFGYKSHTYLTLSGRNDWSSTPESQNRSLFYPGVSLSFIPTSAFNFNSDLINYVKVRAAYATSSGFPSPFLTRNALVPDATRFSVNGNLPATIRFTTILGNINLQPELHREFEIGLDFKLFNNRVSLETSLYSRVSESQIVRAPLQLASGFNRQFINLGRVDNEGVEIDLGIDIFKNDNFSWNFKNIFFADESLVVSTTPTGANIRLTSEADRWAVEGQPLNAIVGSYALRDDNGNLLIAASSTAAFNQQGEIITNTQAGRPDRVIGDPNPDWRLTNVNTLSYKNFRLSTQIEYVHGGDISSQFIENLLERGVTRDTENRNGSFFIPGVLGNRTNGQVLTDANGNTIPARIQNSDVRTIFSNYYDADDLVLFDASVFRIREVSLGYTLKFDKNKRRRVPFSEIDISLTGRNLWYKAPNFPKYTNFDPESDRGLGRQAVPSTKRFAVGLSLKF